jgi:hypothetical protein
MPNYLTNILEQLPFYLNKNGINGKIKSKLNSAQNLLSSCLLSLFKHVMILKAAILPAGLCGCKIWSHPNADVRTWIEGV